MKRLQAKTHVPDRIATARKRSSATVASGWWPKYHWGYAGRYAVAGCSDDRSHALGNYSLLGNRDARTVHVAQLPLVQVNHSTRHGDRSSLGNPHAILDWTVHFLIPVIDDSLFVSECVVFIHLRMTDYTMTGRSSCILRGAEGCRIQLANIYCR